MRNSTDSKNVGVTLCKLALNHRIAASSHKVVIDGGNSDWVNADDALFAGSKCQAQATLRCAADADNIYFLVECRDGNVSKDDYVQVFIAPSDAAKLNAQTLRVKVGLNGLRNQGVYAGNWIEKDLGANAVVRYDATLSDASDVDNGWLAEISVPRSSVKVVDGKVVLGAVADVDVEVDARLGWQLLEDLGLLAAYHARLVELLGEEAQGDGRLSGLVLRVGAEVGAEA